MIFALFCFVFIIVVSFPLIALIGCMIEGIWRGLVVLARGMFIGDDGIDGREVVLRVEPSPAGERALDLALLVDHSGSMAELCAIGPAAVTIWAAIP